MAVFQRILAALAGENPLLHPRENLRKAGNLVALNSEVVTECDGCNIVTVDMRGTFNLTFIVEGSMDGVNFPFPILLNPLGNNGSSRPLLQPTGTLAGAWAGKCAGFNFVRVRVSAFVTGVGVATLTASLGNLKSSIASSENTMELLHVLGTIGAATTLTIPAPGAGMRVALQKLILEKNNATAASLTAAAGPINVTSSGIIGSPSFGLPNDALPAGGQSVRDYDFGKPGLGTLNPNTAITLTAPALVGVQTRIIALYNITQ